MHFDITRPIHSADDLVDTNAQCVAACYNCLLSYYNQIDHKDIDRRNTKAKEILVSLLNSEISGKHLAGTVRSGKPVNDDIQYSYTINGKWTADEYHRSNKTVIFYQYPGEEAEEYISERGLKLIVLNKNE
jgi:hypothetical protein